MIIDTIDHASDYASLGPAFQLAFDYLTSDRPKSDEPGRYDLDGDRVYAMVQEYDTRSKDGAQFEAHRQYADVQFIVSGNEQMGFAPLDQVTEAKPYDDQDDYALYSGDGDSLTFKPGMFAVYFPQDAHMPGLQNGSTGKVRKVVVKVRING